MSARSKGLRLPTFILSLLLFFQSGFGQEFLESKDITKEERDLKVCAFDKDADAVIIFDKAISNYDDNYNLVTEHHVRLKILKENGVEHANVKIPYYSADNFETIISIKGATINYDAHKGETRQALDQKSVYHKKLNKLYSEVSFTFPNVKVGSFIEYRYRSIMKHYGGLKSWYFQKELPVMQSFYLLYIIPNAEFAYQVKKNDFLPITIKPEPKEGRVSFEMFNIPGLKDEPFMASARDYLQRVHFQFAAYTNYMGKKKYSTTWNELSKEFLLEKSFGKQISKGFFADQVKLIAPGLASPLEQMKAIHNYVRSAIVWDRVYSKYSDGVKNVWEQKRGNSGDINLLLINLLKSAGLEVYPMLVSERGHGKVDTTYPFQDQFNNVVAYVKVAGKSYILDGIDRQTPSHMIPFDLLNTTGFIVDKTTPRFEYIKDDNKKNWNFVNLQATVGPEGSLKGEVHVENVDYGKLECIRKYGSDKAGYQEGFLKPYTALKVDSFQVSGLESDTLSLSHTFSIASDLNKSGEYFLLNYNLFTGLDKNPFTRENRFTNIDFGSQFTCTFYGEFNLPDNLVPESLPKDIRMMTPDKSFLVIREIKKQENKVNVNMKIEFNKSVYEAEEYPAVQAFYKKLFDLLNEPVVLTSK